MIIQEGLVKLEVSKDYLKKSHFYNPKMELARDLTILVLKSLPSKNWKVCDTLSALGARGIRIAKETDVKLVYLNDANPHVVKKIKKNVELNKIKRRVRITNTDANQLLSGKIKFDYIDIDPFGSPVFYFDSTARSIYRKGLIGITATDTGALAGSFPKACLRKYGFLSFKTDFYPELGIRILIGSLARALAVWGLEFKPLISYSKEHYYRVFGLVSELKGNLTKNLGYINYCQKCLWRKINSEPIKKCEYCNSKTKTIGRIWIGKVQDQKFIRRCQKKLSRLNWFRTSKQIKKLLEFLSKEKEPLYYDIHKICKNHKLKIPKFEKLMKNLKNSGRTHFCETGIKTDASLKGLLKAVKKSY